MYSQYYGWVSAGLVRGCTRPRRSYPQSWLGGLSRHQHRMLAFYYYPIVDSRLLDPYICSYLASRSAAAAASRLQKDYSTCPYQSDPFRSSLENSLDCIIPSRHEVPISGFQSITHGELGLALNIINSRLKNFRSQVRNALVELGCRNRDVV